MSQASVALPRLATNYPAILRGAKLVLLAVITAGNLPSHYAGKAVFWLFGGLYVFVVISSALPKVRGHRLGFLFRWAELPIVTVLHFTAASNRLDPLYLAFTATEAEHGRRHAVSVALISYVIYTGVRFTYVPADATLASEAAIDLVSYLGLALLFNALIEAADLRRLNERLTRLNDAIVRVLVTATDMRDPYTHGHSVRVAAYSLALATAIGMPEEERQTLYYSALLHDIGKMGLPDRVLLKSGPLTDAERKLMMEHPGKGSFILEQTGSFEEHIPAVRHHHEWMNGSGYPDGLAGNDIPYHARIISVADAFDAMTSSRPYRSKMSVEKALANLREGAGTQFDPDLVHVFCSLVESGEIARAIDHERVAVSESDADASA